MLQKKIFTKGISSDLADELLPDGVDRSRFNLRVLTSENGNMGAIETMKGNAAVYINLPAGANKVIGAKEYLLQKKNYYFVWNAAENHSIIQYDQTSELMSFIMTSSALNFSRDFLITGIDVVKLEENSHLLYWTDGFVNPNDSDDYNEPKKINIEKGGLHMLGNYTAGYNFPFDPEILFRIKQPPRCNPTYTWGGLNDQNSIIKANDSSSSISLSPTTSTGEVVPYSNPFLNPNGEFNSATGIWTVGVSGSYSIDASSILEVYIPPIGGGSGRQLDIAVIRLGSTVTTILSTAIGVGVTAGTGVQSNITMGVKAASSLNQGDRVFVVQRVFNGAATIFHGGGFEVRENSITVNDNNLLFQKNLQFKARFVYDDFEESAWSAISPHIMPDTVKDATTGESIISQDNRINITVETGNSIVTKIKIAAKELGSDDFFEIAELNKSELNIPNNSFYDYEFTNEVIGIPIEINDSIKLFDNVPLTSKSQAIIEGTRITDANITEGFDAVDVDMRLPISFEPLTTNNNSYFPALSYHKDGGVYDKGIVYYDHANRSGLTNVKKGFSTELFADGKYGTTIKIPFLTESGYTVPATTPNPLMSFVPIIHSEIYNKPPSWATHYQILSSKNKAMSKFIQFTVQDLSYTTTSGVPTSSSVATRLSVNIENITGVYKAENPLSNLVYDFVKGDRIRFIAGGQGSGVSWTEIGGTFLFNDTQILEYDSGTGSLVVGLEGASNVLRTMSAGVLFEIYTPTQFASEESELTYEMGECFDIITLDNGDRAHFGNVETQEYFTFYDNSFSGTTGFVGTGGTSIKVGDKVKVNQDSGFQHPEYNTYATVTAVTPSGADTIIVTDIQWQGSSPVNGGTLVKAAQVRLSGGDSFRRYQNMPRVTGGVTFRQYMFMDNMNANNMFVSDAYSYGRPNRIDDDFRRITRPSTVYYSERFIPETFINGLSSVFDVNFESYNQDYGGINKLYAEGESLIMFQETKIARIPISRIIYDDLENNNTVGASATILSQQAVYYNGEFGIGDHPESFAVYGTAKYGIDVRRGAIWRLSTDGLNPISDLYSMHNEITDRSKGIINNNIKVNIYGVYDIKFDEYLISFEQYEDNSGTLVGGITLGFNEEHNQFGCFYNYEPDFMVSMGVDIITFKDGQLWKHNTNPLQANFYGTQHNAEIWTICNAEASNEKTLEAISEETNDAWSIYEITTPNNQTTNLIESDFQEKENMQYAAVWRDENTPNVINPLIEGDVMRDRTFLAKLRYNPTEYNKIFAVNFKFIVSNLHNR